MCMIFLFSPQRLLPSLMLSSTRRFDVFFWHENVFLVFFQSLICGIFFFLFLSKKMFRVWCFPRHESLMFSEPTAPNFSGLMFSPTREFDVFLRVFSSQRKYFGFDVFPGMRVWCFPNLQPAIFRVWCFPRHRSLMFSSEFDVHDAGACLVLERGWGPWEAQQPWV